MAGMRTWSHQRVRTTIVASVFGVAGAAVLGIARTRAKRRRDAGEQAFYDASDGLWPEVPRALSPHVRIDADLAAFDGDPDPAEAQSNESA